MSTGIPAALKPFRRSTWIPMTTEGDGDQLASKFAGKPWLAADESWPMCPHCQTAMPLFVQLNLNTLPAELSDRFGPGLLQLFYCTSSETDECDNWEPFSSAQLARIVQPTGEPNPLEALPATVFPAKLITDWELTDDYPGWTEASDCNLDIPLLDDEWANLDQVYIPHTGDKLSGWPFWVQGVEYPTCPICNDLMQFVFQIDSEDNIPFMFGDVGCGHITQCPTHKEQIGFSWACG